MKTLIKIIVVAVLATFAFACNAQSVQDTTITNMYVKNCKASGSGFPVSAAMHKYIEQYKNVDMKVDVVYSGEAYIDGQFRECVTIYRVTFKLSN